MPNTIQKQVLNCSTRHNDKVEKYLMKLTNGLLFYVHRKINDRVSTLQTLL